MKKFVLLIAMLACRSSGRIRHNPDRDSIIDIFPDYPRIQMLS